MLTPHHLKSLLSSFVYTPAYTCSHILTNEHDPHHYDVVKKDKKGEGQKGEGEGEGERQREREREREKEKKEKIDMRKKRKR